MTDANHLPLSVSLAGLAARHTALVANIKSSSRGVLCSHVTVLCLCLLPRCPRGPTTEGGNGAGNEKTGTGTATGTETETEIVTQEVLGRVDIVILDGGGTVGREVPGEVRQLWINYPRFNLYHF